MLNRFKASADKISVEASGTKILADAGQVPLDRQKAIEDARRVASGGVDTSKESAADRLQRLITPA